MNIKLSGFKPNSLVNGPFMSSVIFSQGCKHHCEGCQNAHTWGFDGGEDFSVEEVMNMIKKNIPIIKGVTFSGGDPMEQPKPFIEIAKQCKALNLKVWCYTGYILEEIQNSKDEDKKELLNYIDALVDGKFEKDNTEGALKYTGSKNQRIISFKNGEVTDILIA